MDIQAVKTLQDQLNAAGYALKVDGVFGPNTRAAYVDAIRTAATAPVDVLIPPAAEPWWRSRAMIGSLAGLAVPLAALTGYHLDAGYVAEVLTALASFAAAALALWGTLKRRAPIDPTLVLPNTRLERSA